MKCSDVRFVKELYPRLKPIDDVIERYRNAIDNLPPITVARGGVLVDGYHRWQAHVREDREDIEAEDLGNLSDAEITRESIQRNATHGQQLSSKDKQRLAAQLWQSLGHLDSPERIADLVELLGVSRDSIERWTSDARASELAAKQDRTWDMWLDCNSQQAIADTIGVDQKTISNWLGEIRNCGNFLEPPESRQHFDIWQFQTRDDDDGQQSYFGAMPPQVAENLLWYFTEPGNTVVDLFAGSGTTIDVAKKMGRRVWAADIRGNHYSPHLPIHTHDANNGWPDTAPTKADLVLLDPPYWRQAEGRYSNEPGELAEMSLDDFNTAWHDIIKAVMPHAKQIAYIISPSVQCEDALSPVDHAFDMAVPFYEEGWHIERRIIVPYQTQQATGSQVVWARENKRMLKLYRDLVVMMPA